jgi:hypothetical protein
MSDFNWCHGPKCHTYHTVDRVRGVKGSKVLRTRKIKINRWNEDTYWKYFCSSGCESAFLQKHIDEFIRLHPRTECQETPINDPKKTNMGYRWNDWEITVDETRQS